MSSHLSPVYLLSLLAVGAYWLWQMAGLGRTRSWPRLGFLMPLGLGALLAAPVDRIDALFGMGLGFILIAAYYPLTTLRRPPTRAHWLSAAGLALLSVLGLSAAVIGQHIYLLLTSLAALLYSLGLLLWAWRYPARQPPARNRQARPSRWQSPQVADPPDLELTLEAQQARVLNTSPYLLEVLGWTPARRNAWWPLRQQSGQVLSTLGSGQTGYLLNWEPLAPGNGGVRLWYTRSGSDEVYLLRADWEDASALSQSAHERVLN